MQLFKKKKKEEPVEEEETAPAPALTGGGGGNVDMKLEQMQIQVTKMGAQISSIMEMRKSFSERFSTINEQMGELRGQLMDASKTMGLVEVKATKAADLVESVQPDKLMIQLQKGDSKIEALRGLLEAKEEMVKNVIDQLRKVRNQMGMFRGVDQIVKMNEELKDEILTAKRIVANVERHSDKVENIFIEAQKSFESFNRFQGEIESIKSMLKENNQKLDKMEAQLPTFAKKKEIMDKVNVVEKSDKHMKEMLGKVEEAYGKLDGKFTDLGNALSGQFDRRMEVAEKLSQAFATLIIQNPFLGRGLNIDEYLEEAKNKEETEGGEEEGEEGSEEGEGEEGGEEEEKKAE